MLLWHSRNVTKCVLVSSALAHPDNFDPQH